jgi:hypothetical protein
MENNEFVKCPLCDGNAKVRRSDLPALLAGNILREKLEENMAEFTRPAEGHQARRKLQTGEFEQEVHNWNPTLPLWRRSPKE